jgi:hypothetical protein
MLVNFYLTKRFFPHDITLIASVVGESVIGHGIGGIDIPAKWCDSLKLVAGVSDDTSSSLDLTATQNRLMAQRSKYVYMLLPIYAQFCYANGDSPYAKFLASLPVRIRGVPVCIRGSGS